MRRLKNAKVSANKIFETFWVLKFLIKDFWKNLGYNNFIIIVSLRQFSILILRVVIFVTGFGKIEKSSLKASLNLVQQFKSWVNFLFIFYFKINSVHYNTELFGDQMYIFINMTYHRKIFSKHAFGCNDVELLKLLDTFCQSFKKIIQSWK